MSQENVDMLMRLLDTPGLNLVEVHRDDALFDAVLETFAPYLSPDFKVVVHGGPEGDLAFVGVDGFRAFWRQWLAPTVAFRQEIRAVDLGDSVLQLVDRLRPPCGQRRGGARRHGRRM